MRIRPISGALGAEILDISISDGLTNSETATIRDAFLENKVIFFREQKLTPKSQSEFARIFGEPDIYPFIRGLEDTPEVTEILKTETDAKNFGGSWHSDTSYMPEPAMGTVLYALETPEFGGDTLFANTAAAYDALSVGLKKSLGWLESY